MAENHVKAEKDYVKGMKYKDIAEKYAVTINTVKSWKTRYKWSRDSVHTKEKSVHTKKKEKASKTKRPQKNRSGNPHPTHKFPNHNSFQSKHGLFSKFLHVEQIEIIEATRDMDILDHLWFQIQLTFSSLVRMQKIMVVDNENSHLKEESGSSWGEGGGSESFKVSFAYEQYESYIKAQTRAVSELRNLIKQFDEMAHIDDERRLKLEGMRLGIEKTKAEVDKISSDSDDKPIEILIKRKSKGDGS